MQLKNRGTKKNWMPNISKLQKEYFLNESDDLANNINTKANELYFMLKYFDASNLQITEEYKNYFIQHHLGRRLFFSIQNSAHIIYQSVKKTGKPFNEINFIDYGAGLGTLYMLAGMLDFKKVVYNDYLPDWKQTAQTICTALQINIDDFVVGDIDAVMQHAAANNIQYQVIASRNVIEHIYSLPQLYAAIYKHNPAAVTYSTTTANFHNPVMRWYHIYIHKTADKKYYQQQRREEIVKLFPSISENKLATFIKLTRGKGQQDFLDAVNNLNNNKSVVVDKTLRSNTCDCLNGVWCEHLLTKNEYGKIIVNAGFKMNYQPGYWDTHYKWVAMNWAAKIFNKLILALDNKGILLSPFVNVTAYN